MIYYLNRGFILEQALADIVLKYFQRLRIDSLYPNFHIAVTNDHPFAHLIIHDEAGNTADMFPSIVITTQNETKPGEFTQLAEQMSKVELTKLDLETICVNKRVRTYIDDSGIEKTVTKRDGTIQYENIPGYCTVMSDSALNELKDITETKGSVRGIAYSTRRKDKVSIDIWAENNQLKNELFEQLRLFIATSLPDVLYSTYKEFDPALFSNSVSCERSNNYNFDFDCILYGSHLSFDVDYSVQQIIIDTDNVDINNIEWEVINHVKES